MANNNSTSTSDTVNNTGKSFSTVYNDPAKWAASRKIQQQNQARVTTLRSTVGVHS